MSTSTEALRIHQCSHCIDFWLPDGEAVGYAFLEMNLLVSAVMVAYQMAEAREQGLVSRGYMDVVVNRSSSPKQTFGMIHLLCQRVQTCPLSRQTWLETIIVLGLKCLHLTRYTGSELNPVPEGKDRVISLEEKHLDNKLSFRSGPLLLQPPMGLYRPYIDSRLILYNS